MRNCQDPFPIEIYMCDPFGVRFACLDYVTELSYTRIAKGIAPFYLKLPDPKYWWGNNRLDNIIEICRNGKMDYCGFLRGWNYAIEDGIRYCELVGMAPKYLMEGRQVAHYTGAAEADITDFADDMIKTIAYNEMGAGASASRSLTSVGGGFTIEQDNSLAPSISKSFAHKNLLDICDEIAAASEQAGTKLYFDIVPITPSITTGQIAFQLRTWIDHRGDDRSQTSSSPIFIGTDWGNLENASFEQNYTSEVNSVTAMGRGSGASQEVVTVTSTARAGRSIWNLREGTVNTDAEYGDTAHLTGDANTYLDENKPKMKMRGDIVENPYFRYGRDFNFGDLVTIAEWNQYVDAAIDKVQVSVDPSGQQTITAQFEAEL